MSDPIAEYTVRDFSAIEEQIKQIAERERALTNRIKIQNLKQLLFVLGVFLLAVGLFFILLSYAYKIAFKRDPEVIQKVEVIEKTLPATKIIIESSNSKREVPVGSTVKIHETTDPATAPDERGGQSGSKFISSAEVTPEIKDADAARNDVLKRLTSRGVDLSNREAATSLLWDNYNDLDLFIQEPSGEKIYYGRQYSSTGGRLDVDANFNPRLKTRQPVENISWPKGKTPKGEYIVYVGFYSRDSREPYDGETPFKVITRVDGKEEVFNGVLKNKADHEIMKIGTFRVD